MTLSAQPYSDDAKNQQVRVRITYGPVEAHVDEHFAHVKGFAQQLLATAELVEERFREAGGFDGPLSS